MKALSNKNIKPQAGFTLIELVVVIVILGILAATAAPKFIDLTADAKKATMEGLLGSINSAVSLAHSKALVAGETGADTTIDIGGVIYAMDNGYPDSAGAGTKDGSSVANKLGVQGFLDITASEFSITEGATTTFQHADATVGANCQISYTNAVNANTAPVIDTDFTNC